MKTIVSVTIYFGLSWLKNAGSVSLTFKYQPPFGYVLDYLSRLAFMPIATEHISETHGHGRSTIRAHPSILEVNQIAESAHFFIQGSIINKTSATTAATSTTAT